MNIQGCPPVVISVLVPVPRVGSATPTASCTSAAGTVRPVGSPQDTLRPDADCLLERLSVATGDQREK